MKNVRLLTTVIVCILLVGDGSVARQQTGPEGSCRYFPETGHYVCDAFRDFFEARGDLEIFGYPLTEAFVDTTHGGLRVQYFQRARMEEHPDNPPPYEVQLGLLVDELGYAFPPTDPEDLPSPDDPAQHYFPETEHVLSYAFLDFYRSKGGLDIFGYPRSDMLYEDGLVVQYFQRARMERHRNRSAGQEIDLTKLGEIYIERFGVPSDADRRSPPPPIADASKPTPTWPPHQACLPLVFADASASRLPAYPTRPSPTTPAPTVPGPTAPGPPAPSPTARSSRITEMTVSASVRYPITGRTGTQTTFIYVNDQEGRPIAEAEARLVVHYQPDDVDCIARPTDASGFTRCSFEIPSPPVGKRVVIDITVTHGGLKATTQTFFMPWW